MNKENVAKVMVDKVERIIKRSNAESKGGDTKTSKRNVVNEILEELDKAVQDEN